MIRKKTKILVSCLAMAVLLLLSGCGFKTSNQPAYRLQLEVWGLFDDSDAYAQIFEIYTKLNPSVIKIEYKKLTQDTYKKDLIDALASGHGPDIFLIHNNWLPVFKDKIFPAPAEVLGEQKFRQNFPDVAASDFLYQGQVAAVPLSVDSIGLYYNKDLFNEAGITAPPANWEEFVADAKRLTKFDSNGQIVQAGAALGTAGNINRPTDILNLLMLQNQTPMVNDAKTAATFDGVITGPKGSFAPAENALNFYTQFAKSNSALYSWNSGLHYSIDAFSEGKLAMMLNYSWVRDTLLSKSPKLNYEVAPAPQLSGNPAVNYANYWGYAVANYKIPSESSSNAQVTPVSNEIRIAEAWKFLSFLTTRPEQAINPTANVAGTQQVVGNNFDPAISYLEKTQKPAARKDLIEIQKSDPKNGVFAVQNLIVKSWYQADPEAIEAIFIEMIEQVNRGQSTVQDAIRTADTRVTQIMNNK